MDIEYLIHEAKEAQKNSYAPYSNYKVGACLLTKNGKYFRGCNVENGAFGPSNCAERTAIFAAVANGEREFEAIAIYGGDGDTFAYPCGVCRQVMLEFSPDMQVIVCKKNGECKIHALKELFPFGFSLKQ